MPHPFKFPFSWLMASLLAFSSCEKPPRQSPAPDAPPFSYEGEKAAEVRKETVNEIVAVKDELKEIIAASVGRDDAASLLSHFDAMRPRLELIQMQASLLPKDEQRVVLGNLAVAANQLEKALQQVLAQDPGNDELALKIVHLRTHLSPRLVARSKQ